MYIYIYVRTRFWPRWLAKLRKGLWDHAVVRLRSKVFAALSHLIQSIASLVILEGSQQVLFGRSSLRGGGESNLALLTYTILHIALLLARIPSETKCEEAINQCSSSTNIYPSSDPCMKMALQDSDKIGFHNEIMFAEEI